MVAFFLGLNVLEYINNIISLTYHSERLVDITYEITMYWILQLVRVRQAPMQAN